MGDPKVVEECPKPHQVPDWIDWDCEKHEAWEKGKFVFNEDSTAYGYEYGDEFTEEESKAYKRAIDNGNLTPR